MTLIVCAGLPTIMSLLAERRTGKNETQRRREICIEMQRLCLSDFLNCRATVDEVKFSSLFVANWIIGRLCALPKSRSRSLLFCNWTESVQQSKASAFIKLMTNGTLELAVDENISALLRLGFFFLRIFDFYILRHRKHPVLHSSGRKSVNGAAWVLHSFEMSKLNKMLWKSNERIFRHTNTLSWK